MKIAKAWTKTLVMKWLIGNKFEEFTLWVELAQILDQLGEVCERQEYLEKTTRWEWCKLDKGYRRNEKAMAPNFSILAWKIPWAEEPGGLQSMGSHRVGHDWSALAVAVALLYFSSDTCHFWYYKVTLALKAESDRRLQGPRGKL